MCASRLERKKKNCLYLQTCTHTYRKSDGVSKRMTSLMLEFSKFAGCTTLQKSYCRNAHKLKLEAQYSLLKIRGGRPLNFPYIICFETCKSFLCLPFETMHIISFSFHVLCLQHEGRNSSPLQHFCLENPRDKGVWWATIQRVTESRIRLSDWQARTHCTMVCMQDLASLDRDQKYALQLKHRSLTTGLPGKVLVLLYF